jgi:GT2 family glycosyltransferase
VTGASAEVGFVVIGRNEGPRLERCLRSVLAVSNRVVYADSASTDRSVATAEALDIAVVTLPADGRLSAARGRNAGYKELRARFPQCDLVQFLDGDCILQAEWIPQSLEFLRAHPDVAVVCGRRFEAQPETSIYNALCDLEWNTPVGEASACGGDALIRCTAFDEVGGYRSEVQAGEEPEMTARMRAAGWRIWRIDVPMTEHDANMHRFRQWWRRAMRGGFAYAQVWQKTARLPRRLYGAQLRSAFAWVLGAPLLIGLAALALHRPALLVALPLLYAIQAARIALSRDPASVSSWIYGGMILLAKIPEAMGAFRFFLGRGRTSLIEYKEPENERSITA